MIIYLDRFYIENETPFSFLFYSLMAALFPQTLFLIGYYFPNVQRKGEQKFGELAEKVALKLKKRATTLKYYNIVQKRK